MTDERKEDFEDEPEEECSWCGDLFPQSELNEDKMCSQCATEQEEDDIEDDLEEDDD